VNPPPGLPRVRALIVDDEALARRRLAEFLQTEPDVQLIGEADSGSAAVEAIADQRPDLVFLDVQMPGLDGFGVLRCTAGAHAPAVVFVTAHDEHAIRAFEVQAVDYLLKPVTALRIREAVRRAVARVRGGSAAENGRVIERLLAEVAPAEAEGPRIPIKQAGRIGFVRVADIDWVESHGDYVKVHAQQVVHLVRETLAEFEALLPEGQFARVRRSVIVNVARVREVQSVPKGGYLLLLQDGTKIRSGRTFRAAVRRLIDRE
jgi:two-component system LytT family response regulator